MTAVSLGMPELPPATLGERRKSRQIKVGSVLVGSREFIAKSRLWRKRMGGGMRQAGIIAAAGLIALEHSPKRLHEDHEKARTLAVGLADLAGIGIDPENVATNIVIFDIAGTGRTQADICSDLRKEGVLAGGWDHSIRMVAHRDVSTDDIHTALRALRKVLRS